MRENGNGHGQVSGRTSHLFNASVRTDEEPGSDCDGGQDDCEEEIEFGAGSRRVPKQTACVVEK